MKRAKILSASAGSGKTYRLALKYICDIIEHPERYRNILAVTFTNKATEEMKSRILSEIHVLASGSKSKYLDNIIKELGLSEAKIREGALKARTRILHDYSRFSVLTIDRFFQRILRAFIKELSLELNYNIELDTTQLLERSADNLVNSIADDEEVRRWLLEYAEERINDGTRWDMRSDLCKLGTELFKENGAKKMNKDIDKRSLRSVVNRIIELGEESKQKIQELGQQGLDVMREHGVEANQFKGASTSFAHCFEHYANGDLKTPSAKMRNAAEKISEWHKKGDDGVVITAAGALQKILKDICHHYDKGIKRINTAKLLRDNYRSFALLADMQQEVSRICDEENIMVLSNTKDILSKFIDDSNAPFIYEKVGNRYDHYMIDEFQDTSVREWRNILPLLKEALASNKSASVFIVGDIKQSIYRWRGGDWRLLNSDAINDLGKENVSIEPLKNNYRSLGNIIKFNNSLISNVVESDNLYLNRHIDEALSDNKITKTTHDDLYDIMRHAYNDYEQEIASKEKSSGYIETTLYDNTHIDSPFIEAIKSAIERGYRYRDILILVRGATDARKVADALFHYKETEFTSKGLAGFNILIPDSLTLEGCDIAEFIIAVLRLAINSNNDIERGVYNRFLGYNLDRKFDDDERNRLRTIAHLSPMEAFEVIVSHYKLHERKESIAFIQAMHEQIINFTTTRMADIQHYLEWWEERGKGEPVIVEMTDDTIEITTIHKAKGLERDIVIIPYARWDMSPRASLKPIVWAKASDDDAVSIGDFPVLYGSTMENSAFAEEYYRELVMSHVDGVNLLYVAVTRASKELYMYIPYNLNSKGKGTDNISNTTPLIVNAVKNICPNYNTNYKEDVIESMIYTYGTHTKRENKDSNNSISQDILLDKYTTNKPSIKVHFPAHRFAEEGLLSNAQALRDGIMLHSIFEGAATRQDIDEALRIKVREGSINNSEATRLATQISQAMTNTIANSWFDSDWDDIKYEADIMVNGEIKRPDRVMIKGDKAVVVDYKFGSKESSRYAKQVAEYMTILNKMGRFDSIEGYVWYISLGKVESVKAEK